MSIITILARIEQVNAPLVYLLNSVEVFPDILDSKNLAAQDGLLALVIK